MLVMHKTKGLKRDRSCRDKNVLSLGHGPLERRAERRETRGQGNNESSLCHPLYAWMTIELKGIVRCRYYVVIVVLYWRHKRGLGRAQWSRDREDERRREKRQYRR